MLTKKSRCCVGGAIPEPLVQAIADLIRSTAELEEAAAAVCGKSWKRTLTKKSRCGERGGIPEPLLKAVADSIRSTNALDKAVAALCGKAATCSHQRCAARLSRPRRVR